MIQAGSSIVFILALASNIIPRNVAYAEVAEVGGILQDLDSTSMEDEPDQFLRVKQGAVLDKTSRSPSPSSNGDSSEGNTRKENKRNSPLDSFFVHYSEKQGHQRALNHGPQQFTLNFHSPLLKEIHKAGGRVNRFYYFNEELPATNMPHFQLEGKQSKRSNLGLSKKRQLPQHQNEPKWTPLTVQTSRGPFHFHLPILRAKNLRNHDFSDADMLREATLYKNPLDFDFASLAMIVDDSPMPRISRRLLRRRRGLGSWLRKVFNRPKKVPPTKKPAPRPVATTADPLDYQDDDYLLPGKSRGQKGRKVSYHADQHGDTEVDWLLPKSLRRSYILAKNDPVKKEKLGGSRKPVRDSFEEESDYKRGPYNRGELRGRSRGEERRNSGRRRPYQQQDTDSWETSRRGGGRRWQSGGDAYPEFQPGAYSYDETWPASKSDLTPFRVRRNKRAATLRSSSGEMNFRRLLARRDLPLNLPMNLPWEPITLVSLDSEPIAQASKEELRLLHELFVNIVAEKCPKGFQARFAEVLEENIFKTLDVSGWPSSDNETSPQMSALIHQLVNCSIAAEGQRDVLQILLHEDKTSKFHTRNEIEMGSPLFRRKRRRHPKHKKPTRMDFEETRRRTSNVEFGLVSFVAVECRHHVDKQLLLSASQLILETIVRNFAMKNPMEEEETSKNLNILQNCANLIMKHRQNEIRLKRKLQETIRLLHRRGSLTFVPIPQK